jgi:hypothetical protein
LYNANSSWSIPMRCACMLFGSRTLCMKKGALGRTPFLD